MLEVRYALLGALLFSGCAKNEPPRMASDGDRTVAAPTTAVAPSRRPEASECGVATKPGPAATKPGPATDRPHMTSKPACTFPNPNDAVDDEALVLLRVDVDESGNIKSVVTECEIPAGQGFGEAARTCIAAQSFEPAHGADGRVKAGSGRFFIRFSR